MSGRVVFGGNTEVFYSRGMTHVRWPHAPLGVQAWRTDKFPLKGWPVFAEIPFSNDFGGKTPAAQGPTYL